MPMTSCGATMAAETQTRSLLFNANFHSSSLVEKTAHEDHFWCKNPVTIGGKSF